MAQNTPIPILDFSSERIIDGDSTAMTAKINNLQLKLEGWSASANTFRFEVQSGSSLPLSGGSITGALNISGNVSTASAMTAERYLLADGGAILSSDTETSLLRYIPNSFPTAIRLRPDAIYCSRSLHVGQDTVAADPDFIVTTKGYVDSEITKAKQDVNSVDGDFSVNRGDAFDLYVNLTASNNKAPIIRFRSDGDTRGLILGYASQLQFQHLLPGGGTPTTLKLFDGFSEFNKSVRGIDDTNLSSFTTKGYVDGELSKVNSAAGGGITEAHGDGRYLKLTGGTLSNDLTVEHSINNSVLRINAVASGRTPFIVLQREGVARGTVSANANALSLEYNGANQSSSFQQFQDRFLVNKPIHGVDENNGNALTTRNYVNTKMDKSGGSFSGDVSIHAQNTTSTTYLTLKNNSLTQAELIGANNRALLRRVVPGGTHTDLDLYSSYAQVNKEFRGVSTTINSDPSSFITKDYFDTNAGWDESLVIDGGTPNIIFKRSGNQSGKIVSLFNSLFIEFNGGARLDLEQDVIFSNKPIRVLSDPATSTDLANRGYVDRFLHRTNGGDFEGDLKVAGEGVLRISRFQNTHKLMVLSPTSGTGPKNTEIELEAGAFKNRIASNPTTTQSYTMVLPPDKPTVGQVMTVASVSDEIVTMEWA